MSDGREEAACNRECLAETINFCLSVTSEEPKGSRVSKSPLTKMFMSSMCTEE